jgi:hypothetical protein
MPKHHLQNPNNEFSFVSPSTLDSIIFFVGPSNLKQGTSALADSNYVGFCCRGMASHMAVV